MVFSHPPYCMLLYLFHLLYTYVYDNEDYNNVDILVTRYICEC